MIDFDAVMLRIREFLLKNQKKEKILDKDIALALQLTPQYYAVMKKRKKVPYEAISVFCSIYELNMNWILQNNKPKYLT